MSLTYLASPYSHVDPTVRHRRFEEVCKVAAELMARGEPIFCPIAHSHPLALLTPSLPQTHEFWMSMDLPILRMCDRVKVLMLDGWQASKGVAHEIRAAEAVGIPVEFITHGESMRHPIFEGIYDDE